MNKQIEEMACAMCGQDKICGGVGTEKCIIYPDYRRQAKRLYNAGYHKQSEGEWVEHSNWAGSIEYKCTACKETTFHAQHYAFCPNCGAKMKGGETDA